MRAITRRRFITRAAAACAAPLIIPSRVLGAAAPSKRIAMGFIGVGGMGSGHLRSCLGQEDVQVLAVCDVRDAHVQHARDLVNVRYGNAACAAYRDYRELLARDDIDAVLIATPDHWHVLIAIEAARQRKHMYLEKPVARTIAEAQALRQAVHRYGVVFQLGTQQRSSRDYRQACQLVRAGRIGELRTILIGGARPTEMPANLGQPIPEGFDYDAWLGPAPWSPYTPERCTRSWTLLHDYSLGCIGGAWGVHDVDIAQWAGSFEATCPVAVEGMGVFKDEGLVDTAWDWTVEHRYANGVRLIHMDHRTAAERSPRYPAGQMGMIFEGTEGWIYVSRTGWDASSPTLRNASFAPHEAPLPESTDHRRNFLDAIHGRATTISGIDTSVNSDIVCHQADIAMHLGRPLQWDPAGERFIDDPLANRMLSRAMRQPWHL